MDLVFSITQLTGSFHESVVKVATREQPSSVGYSLGREGS